MAYSYLQFLMCIVHFKLMTTNAVSGSFHAAGHFKTSLVCLLFSPRQPFPHHGQQC